MLASAVQLSELGSASFRLLLSLPGVFQSLSHPLPCALSHPLDSHQFPFQHDPDLGHLRVLHLDFGKPMIRVQAQAHQEIANAVLLRWPAVGVGLSQFNRICRSACRYTV